MRTTLITSLLAASVLSVGVAATAGAAESGGAEPATPTTTPFNLDALGLTAEQMSCLFGSAGDIDLQDLGSMMDLLTQCGINPMDLLAGVTESTAPGTPTTALGVVPSIPGGSVDPAAAAAVLALLGVDATTAQCIEDGLLGAVSAGDDTEALTILKSCGLTLDDLLSGLVAVNALAGGTSSVTPTLPAVPTTASGVAPSPIVQQLIDTVQTQYGVTLTPDQATCLLDNISGVDPEDTNAMLDLMGECGITLDQLGG